MDGRGGGTGSRGADAPQRHAEVLGLDDHADPPGLEVLLEPVGYLHGQSLLHLEVPGEQLDQPGQLRQAQDPVGWRVADVGHTVERQQVVLAQGLKGDVPGEDQLVVTLVVGERREVEWLGRQELGIGAGDPSGRLSQMLGGRVASKRDEQVLDGTLGRFQVDDFVAADDMEVWALAPGREGLSTTGLDSGGEGGRGHRSAPHTRRGAEGGGRVGQRQGSDEEAEVP